MRSISLFSFLAILFFGASCTSQRIVTNNYLQNSKDTSGKDSLLIKAVTIQKGDNLSIKVFSIANGINPEIDALYNLQEAGTPGGGTPGYLVDQNGDIRFPQLGKLHVEGFTKEGLAEYLENRLQADTALTNPSVVVRFLNYKITVLGEVNSPGTHTLPSENVTILDALGLSGDITDFGRKNNVMVIRENNGHIEKGTIDLTSSGMFSSPYYQLQQNDVVFVESNGRKLKQQERQDLAQQIGIATSIVTAIALILNFIK